MSEERQIEEVFANYVRATDRRNGAAQGALFTDDAIVQIYTKTGANAHEPLGEPLIGGAGVRFAVENFMAPHPVGGSSHHTTSNPIITVNGDQAHFNAQFIVFETRAAEKPADGWPAGSSGVQGTVRTIESGYYDSDLRRIDGHWKITHHRVLNDLPFAIPGA